MPSPHPIDISEEAGVRYLHFGSDWVQGAMRNARPWNLELAYTREMMAGLLLRGRAWPKNALLVGLGAGSLAKFMYRHVPDCTITVVEINPQVELVARQFFKLPEDPRRLRVVIGDGAQYLLAGQGLFDALLVDGYDPQGRAGVLNTLPFYQACRARLGENGLMAVNLLGRNRGFAQSLERIRQAFDGRAIAFPSCDSGNTIIFAATGEAVAVSLENMRQRGLALKEDTGLDLLPAISRLQLTQALPGGILRL